MARQQQQQQRDGGDGRKSYARQFADLKGETDIAVFNTAYPKPDKDAQAAEPGAYKFPLSDNVYARREQRPLLAVEPVTLTKAQADTEVKKMYYQRYFGLVGMHLTAFVLCPLFFSWRNLGVGLATWYFTHAIGICYSYHRQLTHRSFKTPKVLEYLAAWLGAHAAQGDPIEWCSNHRYHHLHTDTPLDPHSPYEGFWWSHMGWFADMKAACERPMLDHSNVQDLTSQAFYRFLHATWFWQLILRHALTQYFLGFEGVAWTLAFPIVYGWHVTFLVNSAAHIWGRRPYNTGDLSTNNWWVALLAAGEGWHNTHHAFPYSARHGLEWFELDITFMLIKALEFFGLAWDIQLPSEKALAAKRAAPEGAKKAAAVASHRIADITATVTSPRAKPAARKA